MSSNNRELSIEELAKVSGGGIKGAVEGVCRKDEVKSGQNDATQMFQQILNQLSGR